MNQKVISKLVAIILFFGFFYFILIYLNRIPPAWDDAWYLSTSVRLYRNLVLGNFFIFIKVFSQAFGGDKAPLISALPTPFYIFFGTSYISAMLVNLCFLILLSLFIFKFTKDIEGSDRAGLFSVVVLNTLPLFNSLARQFMVEYGMSFLVLISVYYLVKSNYLQNDKYVDLLTVIFGFGLLMKVLYPFYLIGPALAVLFYIIRYHRSLLNIKLFSKLSRIIFIGFLIASIWYAFNLKKVFGYGFHSGYGKFSAAHGLGNIFAIDTIIKYLNDFIQNGLSRFYFILFLFCILVLVVRHKSLKTGFRHFDILVLWFLAPFLVLLFAPNKILRFLLPALTPLAIILGIWINRIFKKWGWFILLFPLVIFIITPFIPMPFFSSLLNYSSVDTNSDWKIKEVIDEISNNKTGDAFILCALDHQYYNNFTLDYYSVLKWYPHRFLSPNFFRNQQEAISVINKIDFVLVKTGYLGPDQCNKLSSSIRDYILNNKDSFRQIQSFKLPDDSLISIYMRE